MHKSDFLEVLSALNEKECSHLRSFLNLYRSELRDEVVRLIEYALEHKYSKENAIFDKNRVYNFLFPGQPQIKNKLEKTISEALTVLRKFIAEEMAKRQATGLGQLYLLQLFYHERGLRQKAVQAHRQIRQAAERQLRWGGEEYHVSFLSEYDEIEAQSMRNNIKDDINLRNGIRSLDEYYLVQYLGMVCLMLNQQILAPIPPGSLAEYSMVDINAPGLGWFFDKPLGSLFKKALSLLTNETDDNLEELQDFITTLYQLENEISEPLAALFDATACNLAIRRVNEGNFAYLPIVFEVQKNRLNAGRVYFDGHQIHSSEFVSILTTALRVSEFDWAESFIASHKDRIVGVMPSIEYYNFGMASYLFSRQDYDGARKILMTSDYPDMQCRVLARILEIKAVFELTLQQNADYRIHEYLENRVEAAILFFFRLTEAEPKKRAMAKRFADTVKRIIHAGSSGNLARLQKIAQDVSQSRIIAERQWLLSAIERLSQNIPKRQK